jgi:RNA polymerase sigma-70 factor (ECF subfamily)
MSSVVADIEELIRGAVRGDDRASWQLWSRHRARLKRTIAVRMDDRLSARLDPSDVVQETLAEATRRLPEYAENGSMPFYLWLRQIAWGRLVDLQRRHIDAQKRSLDREEAEEIGLSNRSAMQLADQLTSGGTSPSGRAMREQLRERVRSALEDLAPHDREILVMRHLEQLKIGEIAVVLGISEGAVKMRRLRAAERLRESLAEGD